MSEVITTVAVPATCEEVTAKLTELGYEPVDATDYYSDRITSLKECVYAEKGDIVFFFFELNDRNLACSLFKSNNSQILSKGKYNDWGGFHDNYGRYSFLTLDGVYYDSVWVENTVVYAQCNNENEAEIQKIISTLKYNASTKENRED